MKAPHRHPDPHSPQSTPACHPPPPPLAPGLEQLIDRGMLSRAQADEVTAFAVEVHAAVLRGEMTNGQAEIMGQMLGLRYQQARRLTLGALH